MENFVNEDVDKGIDLSILFRMALTYGLIGLVIFAKQYQKSVLSK
jgi:hypothetical protein